MNRLVCFLMVGLAFTVLQVSTVGAQMGDPNMPPPTGDPNMPPPTGAPGTPPMGDAAAKPSLGERVKSFFGMGTDATPPTGAPGTPPTGDPNMPPPTGAPGAPPMGDPTMAPPTGDISHCAQFSGPPKAACEAAAAGK